MKVFTYNKEIVVKLDKLLVKKNKEVFDRCFYKKYGVKYLCK